MKVEEMRPGKYVAEKQKIHKECSENLLLKKKDFVTVACPSCEDKEYEDMFQKEGYDFVKCKHCETAFISPRPTFDMLMEYQRDAAGASKIWAEKIYPLSEDVRREHIFKPRAQKVVELIKKHNCKTHKLVDVGPGFGTFGEEIEKLHIFAECINVEPATSYAQSCRKKGLTVIESPIEEADIKGVDVITNFELIEHLFDPKKFIVSCKEKLSKNGLLIISTPNSKGFDVSTLGRLSTTYQGPYHLNYFHPDSISHLLESCGFKVVEVLTPGVLDAELVRKTIINRELDISNNPFLKHVLIDKWDTLGSVFQEFLANNNLSSHMWAVAKKTD